jgi:hypothetical protein
MHMRLYTTKNVRKDESLVNTTAAPKKNNSYSYFFLKMPRIYIFYSIYISNRYNKII